MKSKELKWLKENTTSLENKTIVITGSTGGIGEEVSFILARLKANLIFANRNKIKTNDLINKILNVYPETKIEFYKLDLENFENVKQFTDDLKNKKIDSIIHNAAIYNVERKTLDTGFDNVFQVNFLAPHYINSKLINNFSNSSISSLVIISSIAYNYFKPSYNNYQALNVAPRKWYGNTKRLIMHSTYKLVENNNTKISICHPGITLTNMTNHYHKCINWLVAPAVKLLFPAKRRAALNIIYSLFNPTIYPYWIGPKHFNIYGKPTIKKFKPFTNKEKIEVDKILDDVNKFINKPF